jgi:HlyD family secretion protein
MSGDDTVTGRKHHETVTEQSLTQTLPVAQSESATSIKPKRTINDNLTGTGVPDTKSGDSSDTSGKRSMKQTLLAISLRSWLKIGVAALLAIILALYILRNALLGTPSDVYTASKGELVQTIVASGRIVSPQRVTVAMQGSGRVERVAVVEGQSVVLGQLLIELDNSDGRASLAQASAQVSQAQARVRQLGELSQPQSLQALAQAKASALQARKTLTRNRDLLLQGFISQATVDDAQRAIDVADSQVRSMQAQVKTNTTGGSDVMLAQAGLRQAQAGQQLARVKLDQGQVLAPSSGVLISRSVEVGDIVQPGKALMVLAASGQTQILIQIDEKNLSKIKLAQTAYGSADAFANQRFDAVVSYINPGVDATRGSVEVKLTIPNPPAYLRQDMTVSVDIETARRTAAVVIATSTLQDAATDKPWVLVVRGKRAIQQFVTLGLRGDTRVEVLSGITEGEFVLPVSKVGVKPGEKVRPNPVAIPVVTP